MGSGLRREAPCTSWVSLAGCRDSGCPGKTTPYLNPQPGAQLKYNIWCILGAMIALAPESNQSDTGQLNQGQGTVVLRPAVELVTFREVSGQRYICGDVLPGIDRSHKQSLLHLLCHGSLKSVRGSRWLIDGLALGIHDEFTCLGDFNLYLQVGSKNRGGVREPIDRQ
ncbi:hypothetical protein N1851_006329 [Merluccius polli]|uniref:Uncharacterized protein n=1 Tax=Merluccius polli TaxID=89951 RepID=A0AA47N4U6_MERPO|nr:hypothetical protein N1851_006329 [Merluccius polli]